MIILYLEFIDWFRSVSFRFSAYRFASFRRITFRFVVVRFCFVSHFTETLIFMYEKWTRQVWCSNGELMLSYYILESYACIIDGITYYRYINTLSLLYPGAECVLFIPFRDEIYPYLPAFP